MSQFQADMVAEEDDHQARLEYCKTFFSNLKSSCERSWEVTALDGDCLSLNSNELHDTIILFFYDRWSVIRFHSFKSLRDLVKFSQVSTKPTRFIPSYLYSLLHTWQQHILDFHRPWQELHGCLLGFTAVIDILDLQSPKREDEIFDLIDICVEIMSHVRNPIRDAAKDCLVKIGEESKYRRDLFSTLLNTIDAIATIGVETEAATLKVDGLLGALVEIVPVMHNEINLQVIDNGGSPRSSLEAQSISSLAKVSGTIKLCMRHPASTVRQKAGSILSSIMKFSLTDAFSSSSRSTTSQFSFLSKKVLVSLLEDQDLEAWQSHEACLIVCEELIREATTLHLNRLAIPGWCIRESCKNVAFQLNPPQPVEIFIIQLNDLSEFLHSKLKDLLCHPRFEVRRVMLQLLPTMARGWTILFSQLENTSNLLKDITIIQKSPVFGTFDLMVDMIWLSTLIKEARHVEEILYTASATTFQSNGQSNEVFLHPGESWSLEVHGRLLEVELRAEFHKQLEGIIQVGSSGVGEESNNHARGTLCRSLLSSTSVILSLLSNLFDALDNYHIKPAIIDDDQRGGIFTHFLSIDFVELIALSHCFVFTVIHRMHDIVKSCDMEQSNLMLELEQTAHCLRSRLNGYNSSWIKMMALLQLNSNVNSSNQPIPATMGSGAGSSGSCVNHINSTSVSFSANRPTSSEMIVLCMAYSNDGDSSLSEVVTLKQKGVEFQLQDNLRLLPTLTDPATNPVLYAEDVRLFQTICDESANQCFSANAKSRLGSPLSSPLRIQVSSSTTERVAPSTPNCNQQNGATVFFPSLTPGTSAKSSSITSPNRVGVGCNLPVSSNISTYHCMNRWNCEAISPLLYNISCNFRESVVNRDNNCKEIAMMLACIAAEWQINVMADPLWLDHRKFAKRTLVESIEKLLEIVLDCDQSADLYIMSNVRLSSLMVYLTRTLAEILCVESRQNRMDFKWIGPVIRGTEMCLSKCLIIVDPHMVASSHDAIFRKNHRLPYHLQDIILQTVECLHVSVESLMGRFNGVGIVESCNVDGKVFTGSLLQRFADTLDFEQSSIRTFQNSTTISPIAAEGHTGEDEFSDWDDEDDESDSRDGTETSSSAAFVTSGASLSVIHFLESLHKTSNEWRRYLMEKYDIQ